MFLLYHDVLELGADPNTSGFPGRAAAHYKLDAAVFDKHLDAVVAARVPLTLTFDDCGASTLWIAERLASRGLTGVFCAPTAHIGKLGFCTVADLRALRRNGHLVASHSHNHPIPISALDDKGLREEWSRSRETLEDWLGEAVVTASIPGGFISRTVLTSVQEAGYASVLTSEPTYSSSRWESLTLHGRYSVTRSTTIAQVQQVASGSGWPWRKQQAVWIVKKGLKRVGGRAWLMARERLFEWRGPHKP